MSKKSIRNAIRITKRVRRGPKLDIDKYPTKYMPNVGRQVMAEGGPVDPDVDHEIVNNAVQRFGLTRNPREAGFMLHDGRMLDFSGRHEDSSYERIGDFHKPSFGEDYMKDRRYTDHRDVSQIFNVPSEDYVNSYIDQALAGQHRGSLSREEEQALREEARESFEGDGLQGLDAVSEFMKRGKAVRVYPGEGIEVGHVPSAQQIAKLVRGHNQHYPNAPFMVDVTDYSNPNASPKSKTFPKANVEAVIKWIREAVKSAPEKAEGGKVSSKNLFNFMKGNHPEVPHIVYHGTNANFSKFRLGSRGFISLSTNPEFASIYTEGYQDSNSPSVMPVHVSAKNPFNYEDLDNLRAIESKLGGKVSRNPEIMKEIASGDWSTIESYDVQRAIKSLGHDSFFMSETDPETGERYKNIGVYSPLQIKSAIGNIGAFDPTNPDITKAEGGPISPNVTLAPQPNELGLYSHGAFTAANLPQPRGTPQQYRSVLEKQGVKPDEFEHSGWEEAFANRPSVTREEVAQHFQQNNPKLQETVLKDAGLKYALGEEGMYDLAQDASSDSSLYSRITADHPNTQPFSAFEEPEQRIDYLLGEIPEVLDNHVRSQNDYGETTGITKFTKYAIPGGENYREVLLSLSNPEKKTIYKVTDNNTGAMISSHSSEEEARNELSQLSEGSASLVPYELPTPSIPSYTSSHWDEPDVLAHLRMSDREVPTQGFAVRNRRSGNNSEAFATREEADAYLARMPENLRGDLAIVDAPGKPQRVLHLEEIQSDWAQEGRKRGFKNDSLIKSLELKEDALRRQMVVMTGDEPGYKQLWSEFREVQKQLDEAGRGIANPPSSAPYVTNTAKWTDLALKRALHEAVKGDYDAIAITPGEEQAKRYDLSKQISKLQYFPTAQRLYAVGKGGEGVIDNYGVTPEQVPDFVGKEVAEKLLHEDNAIPNKYSEGILLHELTGQNLSVGGEGMKSFYDKIVPTQLNKITQKMDKSAKVRMHHMPIHEDHGPVHYLPITDKMREAVRRGLPMFAQGGEVSEEGQANEHTKIYHGGADVETDSLHPLSFFTEDMEAAESYRKDKYGSAGLLHESTLPKGDYATDDDVLAVAKHVDKYLLPGYFNEFNNPHMNLDRSVVGEKFANRVSQILKDQGFVGAKLKDISMDPDKGMIHSYVIFKNLKTKNSEKSEGGEVSGKLSFGEPEQYEENLAEAPATNEKNDSAKLIPAIRYNGKIYKPVIEDANKVLTHMDALKSVPSELRNRATLDANSRGYVNDRGRYMDRFRAQQYAVDNQLHDPKMPNWVKTAPELVAEWLKKPSGFASGGGVGSEVFNKDASASPSPSSHTPYTSLSSTIRFPKTSRKEKIKTKKPTSSSPDSPSVRKALMLTSSSLQGRADRGTPR